MDLLLLAECDYLVRIRSSSTHTHRLPEKPQPTEVSDIIYIMDIIYTSGLHKPEVSGLDCVGDMRRRRRRRRRRGMPGPAAAAAAMTTLNI